MIHAFQQKDKNIVLDVNSGCVHVMDPLCFALTRALDGREELPEEIPADVAREFSTYSPDEVREAYAEILELYRQGVLFSKDEYAGIAVNMKKRSPVKALCLHIAHDCNLRCRYCFADEGAYHRRRELMSAEIGKKAIDFLIANSAKRRNLEVDFFGGEPLMNFGAVKEVVEYAREQEKLHGKRFRFTVTTNGLLLNDENMEFINREMGNVVLSLDGRKEVNDRMRGRVDGGGSYDIILPKLQKMAESRHQDNYYVRGTFTRYNTDFAEDVRHIADLGFKQISVEPVVGDEKEDYVLRWEDLPQIFAEYDRLAELYLQRRREGNGFNFFHFMIDLEQGPCVIKRLSGCGAGCEYLAVAPNGDIYPCHQFVGHEEYRMGSLRDGKLSQQLREKFEDCNVYTKPDCVNCFAKFYCSGGCMANACLLCGDINRPHEMSCALQRKRVECALYIKAAEAEE